MDQPVPAPRRGLALDFLLRLKLWHKFALLGAVALALTAFPLYRTFAAVESAIAQVRTEQSGLEAITAALEVIRTLQDHRGAASYLVLGDEQRGAAQPKMAAEVDNALAKLDRVAAGVKDEGYAERMAQARRLWTGLKENVAARRIDQRTVTDQHGALIRHLLFAVDELVSVYGIDLDGDPATYHMFRATLVELPRLSETLGQLRSPVVSRLQALAQLRQSADPNPQRQEQLLRDAFRPGDRARVAQNVEDLQDSLDSYLRHQRKAIQARPELEATIGAQTREVQRATTAAIALVRREILGGELPTIEAGAYLKDLTVPREQVQKAATQQQLLTRQLDQRVSDARADRAVAIGVMLALLALGAGIAVAIVRNITTTVAQLQASVERVRGGDATALQQIASRDEVGDLGRTVNSLLQERITAQEASEAAARQAEAENERLNNSVIGILQAVHQLSQRDLTAKAPVTQDVIGTVSDSINLLADETARVLHSVTQIAGQVAAASGNVRTQAELVSKTAEDERGSVDRMVESLSEATDTMNRVSELAQQSNSAAAEATRATNNALETVTGTVRGMEAIRETIAETEKRIKRLGERSQEISGIVNLINTISERTHVLALNASMQAAVAGEAGRGFAVVAEEVQRLAESSRNATQQIATLVGNIQVETNETIATVNRTIGQVVDGSGLAQKAGEQMRRTQEITEALVAQVRRIGEASAEQQAMSGQLLQAVQRIGDSTERTGQQIVAQHRETETLLASAHRLLDSVNVFKLPQAA